MILAFASKPVGLATLGFVLDRGDPVGRVIVGADSDDDIIELCRRHGVPVEVGAPQLMDQLVAEGRRYRWLLNLFCPLILRRPVLDLARHRVNLHTGLVPACRGNDGAAWIIRDDLPAGVSLLEMDDAVDTGAIWAEKMLDVEFPVTGNALNDRMKHELEALFRETWPKMLAGEITPNAQQGQGRTYTRRQTNADRRRLEDETMTLGQAVSWMLAHDFPGTTAELERKDGSRYRLRLAVERIS